jgi:cytochrome c oxidase subunit 2
MRASGKMLRLAATAGVLAAGMAVTYVAAQTVQPKEKVIKVTAKRFTYTPSNLTLKKGEPVILEFDTQDVLMGFNLPDFNVRADIVPDKVTRVRFVPDKAGTFAFLCDIFCGSGHEEMNGHITVVD